jgi:hypothetical protein
MPLADNDVKCELSYAYLHAVAAKAGCECQVAGRLSDHLGIDARLHVNENFGPEAVIRFTLDVQLKATSTPLQPVLDRYSFSLPIEHYDKLRFTSRESPLLLVVLQLPAEPEQWLKCTPRALTLKKCAYWVSLYGAPPSANVTAQTVYLPRKNLFTVDGLRALLARFARRERMAYDPG